jgi:Ala-tRNA(Pro) deacylase
MDIKNYLTEKGIEFKSFEHPAVYTCEEAEKQRIYTEIRGTHSKNLFLKERKSRRFYLVVLPADKKLDIGELGNALGDKLKFANEDDLKGILGLTPGAVSPFGLINDTEHKVIVVIDQKVWHSDYLSFHPNVNTETLELSGRGFQKYIKSLGNQLKIV